MSLKARFWKKYGLGFILILNRSTVEDSKADHGRISVTTELCFFKNFVCNEIQNLLDLVVQNKWKIHNFDSIRPIDMKLGINK